MEEMKIVLAKLDAVLGLLREAKQGIGSSYNVENEHDMANALSLLTRIGHAEYQLYEIMSLIIKDIDEKKNCECPVCEYKGDKE